METGKIGKKRKTNFKTAEPGKAQTAEEAGKLENWKKCIFLWWKTEKRPPIIPPIQCFQQIDKMVQ